ncbi:MAG: hypothetical protein ABI045_00585 [Flavobacteriales bacterium]
MQQKLDHFSHHAFIDTLTQRNVVCGITSEEDEDFIPIGNQQNAHQNKYIVLINQLDGSSNINVNISINTIFSIYTRIPPLNTPMTIRGFFTTLTSTSSHQVYHLRLIYYI